MPLVFLNHPLCRQSLSLERTPRFLRFVCRESCRKWDALDQPDDIAADDEFILAAIWSHTNSVHVDGVRDGKRFGEWRKSITYKPIEPQPPQDLLRDNERWRSWCMAENERTETDDGR